MPLIFNNHDDPLLTYEDASELRDNGWIASDLHVHTLCSYDVLPAPSLKPEALYEKGKKLGLRYITFTDHDTMRAHQILGEQEELITGVEIRIKDTELAEHTVHVNVYDLGEEEFDELEEISKIEGDLKALVNYVKRKSIPFTYNHPFWFEPKEEPNLSAIPELIELFPVVEYNMHRVKKNELAIALARKQGKGLVATTDSHPGMIGKVYTLSKGDTFREYFKNIAAGRSYLVASDLTM